MELPIQPQNAELLQRRIKENERCGSQNPTSGFKLKIYRKKGCLILHPTT
jgi:hypothetical protein